MKIVRRKSDLVVTHLGDNFDLSKDGLFANGVINRSLTPETAEMMDVESVPLPWCGGYYTYDQGWVLTDLGRAALIAAKKEEIPAIRYEKEISGAIVDGQLIHTDLMSQLKLTMATLAALLCQLGPSLGIELPEFGINWKGKDGTWSAKDAGKMITAFMHAVAIGQALFDAEKAMTAAVDADPETDITKGWPI